jgi:hypothetical protein
LLRRYLFNISEGAFGHPGYSSPCGIPRRNSDELPGKEMTEIFSFLNKQSCIAMLPVYERGITVHVNMGFSPGAANFF